MTVGLEVNAAGDWIRAQLAADATLMAAVGSQVYESTAPREAVGPWITMYQQSSVDIRGVGTIRVGTNDLWMVRGCIEGTSYVPLRDIARRIDLALHGASGSVADGVVFGCVRESPWRRDATDNGIEYRQQGGIYRLWVQG